VKVKMMLLYALAYIESNKISHTAMIQNVISLCYNRSTLYEQILFTWSTVGTILIPKLARSIGRGCSSRASIQKSHPMSVARATDNAEEIKKRENDEIPCIGL